MCAESRSLDNRTHGQHSLGRDAVPADRCTRMVNIPLQPLTVASTRPAHAFHPGATPELAGQDRHPPGVADA